MPLSGPPAQCRDYGLRINASIVNTWKPKIYVRPLNSHALIPLEETRYASEDLLQEFLADCPDLIPGDQIDPVDPRRWLLVTREMPVPDSAAEGGRWSLDHLFLDQDGIPTFIECKRAADTRGRREVVAQMLDYAANGLEYWSIDQLRQAASDSAIKRGKSLDVEIASLLGDGVENDEGTFWKRVESNLREGKVRLIFVGEETPKELRRLVEFLNLKMTDVEVLAVEVKQYLAKDHVAIVPRVVGITEATRRIKDGQDGTGHRNLTLDEFVRLCSDPVGNTFRTIHDESVSRGHVPNWGPTRFSLRRASHGQAFSIAYCYPGAVGKLELYLDTLCPAPRERIDALRNRMLSSYPWLRPAGQYTLRADVTPENVTETVNAFRTWLDGIDELMAPDRPLPDAQHPTADGLQTRAADPLP